MSKYTAADFAKARFAIKAEQGGNECRAVAHVSRGSDRKDRWTLDCTGVGRSDAEMAEEGFVPLRERLDATRHESPDLMDGGVTAAMIEQEVAGSYTRTDEEGWQARAEKAEKERDEARAELRLHALREKLTPAAEPRPFTAREHLTAAWEAAHVPADGIIPAGAEYLWRSAASRRVVQGVPDDVDASSGAGGSIERRLLDPPPPARPEGAEEIERLLMDADREGGEVYRTDGYTRLSDYLAEGLSKGGVRVVTEEEHTPACEGGKGAPCDTCGSYWAGDQEKRP